MTKEIRIRRNEKEIIIKIEKEYNVDNVDNELSEYLKKIPNKKIEEIGQSITENKSKIFKIVLEDNENDDEIRDMYDDKRQTWMSRNAIIYEECSQTRDVKECMNNIMPPLYGILIVKTEDIIPEVVKTPVAQGVTRRRRKGKRKSRNNRKKTNRRR